MGHTKRLQAPPISLHTLRVRLALAFSVIIMSFGCAASDPELRSAIREAERDPLSAREKLRPFAIQGNAKAIAEICIAYGRSLGSRMDNKDRVQAFVWCSQAANAEVLDAQYHLGKFYQYGSGTNEDRTLALRWLTVAAERGHAEAENARRGMLGLPSVCKNWITNCRMF